MNAKRTSGKPLTGGGHGLLVLLMALCLLGVGSPTQAYPRGSEYDMPFMAGTLLTKDGDSLAMSIEGTPVFSLGQGKSIDAAGIFVMTVGGDTVGGTWEAVELESFNSFGSCGDSLDCLARVAELFDGADGTTWEAGRVRAKIVLRDEDGNVVGRGRLTVTCSLPFVPAPPVKDYVPDNPGLEGPEGFQVDMGSLHFGDGGRQQRSLTLFTRLAD